METGDLNMNLAYHLAERLGPPPNLPPSLADVARRAKLINAVDGPPMFAMLKLEDSSANSLVMSARQFVPDVQDDTLLLNVVLRLWSGCLAAAKTIAAETRSGPNTPLERSKIFSQSIDPIAQTDPIFRAGVEAAPCFKSLRNQDYSFDGVPDDSAVRRFSDSPREQGSVSGP